MLRIRLARGGAKKRPYHRIVVAERESSRNGRFVELIGFSNPMASGADTPLRLDLERYRYWLGQGAQPTDAVKLLARRCQRQAATGAGGDAQPTA